MNLTKTWRITVKHNPSAKRAADAVPAELEQQTDLSRTGLNTEADVERFVKTKWKHLLFVRAVDITPPAPESPVIPAELPTAGPSIEAAAAAAVVTKRRKRA